ncbi:hypothetical protein [Bizionia myxarmorum]|uniref:Uncharacterized protein n=1 Tax=Bizionia myxarmorum TaxID=291186 RepID=A0A5D0R466_9FLAO|nr:hypothetical protein [Bizionia myxarmorum]TYB76380.1 hypothetical protein ES674_12395 [Bizionia myxarmorum]
MDNSYNFNLNSQDGATLELAVIGITNFINAGIHVQNLPYRRNLDRSDYSLVIFQQKGMCFIKHAYLAALAHANVHFEVKLYLGM